MRSGSGTRPVACASRFAKRAAELDLAIIAESARWGGFRRFPPYTRDREWISEQRRLLHNYFPRRSEIVFQQLRAAGLYPDVAAPNVTRRQSPSSSLHDLSMSDSAGGVFYFTLNGIDPRVPGTDAVSPHAKLFTAPFQVEAGARIRARALTTGHWSALVESYNSE